MYPRFLQMFLNVETHSKLPYLADPFKKNIFGNMARNFKGAHIPLLAAMLSVGANSTGTSSSSSESEGDSQPLVEAEAPTYEHGSSSMQPQQPPSPTPPSQIPTTTIQYANTISIF